MYDRPHIASAVRVHAFVSRHGPHGVHTLRVRQTTPVNASNHGE